MEENDSPQLLDRYRLLGPLGVGGMGEVYLAKSLGEAGFEKLVAVKLLSGAERAQPAELQSLLREALIGVQLDHEHIVQILDLGKSGSRHYVVMEYVRGFSLGHILRHLEGTGDVFPLQVSVHMARAVADALRYVHGRSDSAGVSLGLLHGDVTPSNILMSRDGRIKLSDFGVAAFARELAGRRGVAGKPRYLPPEAHRGASPSPGWDMYSLGVTLFEVLTGRRAFESLDEIPLRELVAAGLPGVRLLRPECPAELEAVIRRITHPDPAHRLEEAGAFLSELEAAWPRRLDDEEVFRGAMTAIFDDPAFVSAHGPLPSTGSLARASELTGRTMPIIEESTPKVAMGEEPLRFGLSPALSSDLAREYGDRLAGQLSQRLNRGVRAIVFGDYQSVSDCVVSGEVELAWTPPLTFIDVARQGAGLLVMMQRSGQISYESAIIVRADDPRESPDEISRASAAWVDRRSAAGYLCAYASLLRSRSGSEPLLGRQHFHGSHRAVCEAVANGWADIGATYAVRDPAGVVRSSGWLDLMGERSSEIRPLAFVGPIPSDCIAHTPGLPSETVVELVSVLTSLHLDPVAASLLERVLGAQRLIPGVPELYRSLEADLDLVAAETGSTPIPSG